MWVLFEGGDYSKAASIRRNTVILVSVNALICIDCIHHIRMWMHRVWIVCVNSCWGIESGLAAACGATQYDK